MKRRILAIAASVFGAFSPPAFAATCDSLSALEGLLGEWTAERAHSTIVESWRGLGPATWAGRGIETPKAGGSASVEDLRLVAMGGGVFYVAKVAHNELPVAFRLIACDGGRFIFENPGHDFPRRLDYRIGADGRLTVDVGDGAGKGFTLEFARDATVGGEQAAVLDAEDARFAAMVAGDREGMLRAFAEDLAYVHSTGSVQGRDELVAAIAGGELRYLALEPAERNVVFLGPDAAYVRGRARVRARMADRDADFQVRYLAVYGLIAGNWRLRAWQSLRMP